MHDDRGYRNSYEDLVSEKYPVRKRVCAPPTKPSMIGPRANHKYVPGRFSHNRAVVKNTKSDSMRPPTLNASTVMRP